MRISKEFKFEMAHKLSSSYTCKCRNVHGHSYKAVVTLQSKTESFDMEGEFVVLDFTLLKEILDPYIKKLDHNFLIHDKDESCVHFVLGSRAGRYPLLVSRYNPTAEFLANLLANTVLEDLMERGITYCDVEVTIWETATACATAKGGALDISWSRDIDEYKVINGRVK